MNFQPGQTVDIQFPVPSGTKIVGGGARIASPSLGGLTFINSAPVLYLSVSSLFVSDAQLEPVQ